MANCAFRALDGECAIGLITNQAYLHEASEDTTHTAAVLPSLTATPPHGGAPWCTNVRTSA
eukprot:15447232-Alexandrium_andersonii.AAC.1